MNITLLH